MIYRILNPENIKKKPVNALIISALFVLFGFLTAFFIFSSEFSIAMIAFSSLLILPFVVKVLETEKFTGHEKTAGFLNIFKRHDKTILFFIFIFFGMAVEYMLLFGFVHPSISNVAFEHQIGLIFRSPSGYFATYELFWEIVSNNLRLVFICAALSILYGVGAVFILNYNATIVGMIYGSGIRRLVWGMAYPVFPNPMWYLPHIILEILAYLFASIAGGIIFRSIVVGEKSYNVFSRDAAIMLLLAVILVFVAGYVEVTVPFMAMG